MTPWSETAAGSGPRPVLITGGAGFVGCKLAARLLSAGEKVIVFDNLSRPGAERNLEWLREAHGRGLEAEIGDVRDAPAVRAAVRRCGQVFHFAAQVAVTTSLADPVQDFECNLRGTLNVLEAVRRETPAPPLIFTSTNKVYGSLPDVSLRKNGGRYEPASDALRRRGIAEDRPVDFHSPYGCSKGGADQYVLDYARIFNLRTVVFRMSCIYGPRQFGTEDQGWVANFLIRALDGRAITLYGDGMQVRDILFIEDLVDAFLLARERMKALSGQAFNIGGGPENTVSLVELLDLIREISGAAPPVRFGAWRSGDQKYYVTDSGKFRHATGWSPRTGVREGVGELYRWLAESRCAGPSSPRAGNA